MFRKGKNQLTLPITKKISVLTVIASVLVLYSLFIAGVYAFQRSLLLFPKPLPQDHLFQFTLPFEEHFLETPDGAFINALYIKTTKQRRGVVLYLHGNADNLQRWGQVHPDFSSRGYDFFIFDYRGFGKSTGKATESNMIADAHLAYDFLRQSFSMNDIVIFGRSLGSGVASDLAKAVPARALVLETPFYSIPDVFRAQIPVLIFPFSPPFRFRNDKCLSFIDYPIHILQGTDDRIVPLHSAIKLRPLLKRTDTFTVIEGGRHNDLSDFEEYQTMLDQILG